MSRITKQARQAAVTGLITALVAGGAVTIYWPSAEDNPKIDIRETNALHELETIYMEENAVDGQFTMQDVESSAQFFDRLHQKMSTYGYGTTTIIDKVCREKPGKGEKPCRQRKVEYASSTVNERVKNLINRANPDAL